jgi:sulfate transport system permease protein
MANTKRHRVLPGFGLSVGYALAFLGLIVLLPLAALAWKASGIGLAGLLHLLAEPRTQAALKLSFGGALAASLINAMFGLLVAWVLVRYRFPGRRLLDALVDLPFALPTAVAGIALTALYAPNGWLGRAFDALGVRIAYTPLGVGIAMVFVGFPFVVRTLQPVLESLDREMEEAAESLGARRSQVFARVILPVLVPALLTGFALALARAVGEYGSVIFIAGNMPMRTEIAPLLIVQKLEQYDYAGAAALGVVMLGFSFVMLVALSLLQRWSRRWAEASP